MKKNYNNSVEGSGYVNNVYPIGKDKENARAFFVTVANTVTGATYNLRVFASNDEEAAKLREMGKDAFENRRNAKTEGFERKTHTLAFEGIYKPANYDAEQKKETTPAVIEVCSKTLEPTLKGNELVDSCTFAGNLISMNDRQINGKDALSVTIATHHELEDGRKMTDYIDTLVFKNEKPGAYEQLKESGIGDFIRIEGRMGSDMLINTNNVILLRKKGEKVSEAAEVKEAPAKKAAAKAEKAEGEKKGAKRTSRKKNTMSL